MGRFAACVCRSVCFHFLTFLCSLCSLLELARPVTKRCLIDSTIVGKHFCPSKKTKQKMSVTGSKRPRAESDDDSDNDDDEHYRATFLDDAANAFAVHYFSSFTFCREDVDYFDDDLRDTYENKEDVYARHDAGGNFTLTEGELAEVVTAVRPEIASTFTEGVGDLSDRLMRVVEGGRVAEIRAAGLQTELDVLRRTVTKLRGAIRDAATMCYKQLDRLPPCAYVLNIGSTIEDLEQRI